MQSLLLRSNGATASRQPAETPCKIDCCFHHYGLLSALPAALPRALLTPLMLSDVRKAVSDEDGALWLCNCKKKLGSMPAQSRSPCAAHSHECGSGTGPASQPFGPAPHFWSMRGALARCRCGKGSPTRPLSRRWACRTTSQCCSYALQERSSNTTSAFLAADALVHLPYA